MILYYPSASGKCMQSRPLARQQPNSRPALAIQSLQERPHQFSHLFLLPSPLFLHLLASVLLLLQSSPQLVFAVLQSLVSLHKFLAFLVHGLAQVNSCSEFELQPLILTSLMIVLNPHFSAPGGQFDDNFLLLLMLALQFLDPSILPLHSLLQTLPLLTRRVELKLQIVRIGHRLAPLHSGGLRFFPTALQQVILLLTATLAHSQYKLSNYMLKIVLALLLLTSCCCQLEDKEEMLKETVDELCSALQESLNLITTDTQKVADEMNRLLAEGHIDHKDPYKSHSKEVIKLSSDIARLSKKTEKIYSDPNYIKYCLALEEELSYRTIPTEEFKQAINSLTNLKNTYAQDAQEL